MIVFSADWQMVARNLDKIKRVEESIWEIHKRKKLLAFVHAGDVKHILNPVDGRVVNYAVDMIQRMTQSFPVHILLGNHDKFSNQAEGDNWFPVLEAAGATVYTKPGWFHAGPWRLHMLPFHSDLDVARKWAKKLAQDASERNTVLVIHETVVGASLTGRVADFGLTLDDIHADKYFAVVGGHIHKPQQIGNLQYIGSPFAHDWGEVNQRKFLMTLGKTLGRVELDLPGLFDPSRKDFYSPKTWDGSTVRLTVTGPDEVLGSIKEAALEQGQKDYPGATVVVTALREDAKANGTLKVSRDDATTIKRYVSKNIPPVLEGRKDELSSYLVYKLGEVGGGVRTGDGVRFVEAEGKNVLSFETVRHVFASGISVIRGQSMDWKDRSNGAGKTNFVQLVAIALTGKTMKGQIHDSWARRGSLGECYVKLTMVLPDGRELVVERRRRPKPWLKLWLGGNPHHTGAGPKEAQRELEDLTGFTFETLENSVYLDQGRVNQMLSGTDAERKALLAKFLNLERFTRAQELVKKEAAKIERQREVLQGEIQSLETSGANLKETLDTWKQPDVGALKKKLVAANRAVKGFTVEKLVRESTDALDEELAQISQRIGGVQTKQSIAQETMAKAEKLGPVCGKCGQKVPKSLREDVITEQQETLKKLDKQLTLLKEQRAAVRQKIDKVGEQNRERERIYFKQKNELLRLESTVENLEAELKKAEAEAERRDQLAERLKSLRAEWKLKKKQRDDADGEAVFIGFCVSAFGRLGIPAALMAETCPALNAAAAYYSDLICNGELKVSFRVDGDAIGVDVTNKYGGETLADQSCGETRTASLIVSLATLETTTQCNLLVADEPGGGLDEVGAAGLSQVLATVAGKFGSVLIISHNPYILAELEDYPQIVVEKSSGISKVC